MQNALFEIQKTTKRIGFAQDNFPNLRCFTATKLAEPMLSKMIRMSSLDRATWCPFRTPGSSRWPCGKMWLAELGCSTNEVR